MRSAASTLAPASSAFAKFYNECKNLAAGSLEDMLTLSRQVQNEKATRYISSLNTARCDGSWNELPELIRKVTKHAPQRQCRGVEY